MPSLVYVCVRISRCRDWCRHGYETGNCGDDSCEGCSDSNGQSNSCVLLEGLSGAVNLELTAETKVLRLHLSLDSYHCSPSTVPLVVFAPMVRIHQYTLTYMLYGGFTV